MIRTNSKMRSLLKRLDKEEIGKLKIDYAIFKKIELPEFVEKQGCVLVNLFNNTLSEVINIDYIIKTYGDLTGYEATRNEVRVNDYLKIRSKEKYYIVDIATQILEIWGYKLKNDFPKYKFCLLLSYNNGYATIRFHRERKNELNWLEEDLESYEKEAILLKNI